MQYHPKLKKAMEQIKVILAEHDIAAHVVLHTPGFCEYLNHITPSYSCAKPEGESQVRFTAKAEDFGGDKRARDKKIADTINMFSHFEERLGHDLLNYMELTDRLTKLTGATNGPSDHTSHNQQNN